MRGHVEPEPIVKTPGTCGGNARIAGTRVSVWALMTLFRVGFSVGRLCRSHGLRRSQVEAAIRYAMLNWPEINADLRGNGHA